MYRTTGLVGLVGTTAPGKAAAAADALLGRLEALAKGVKEESLSAAKALVVGGYSSATSGKMGVVQDMGGQLLARGSFSSGEFVAAVSGLKAGDVTKAVGDMLKGAPTLVATGALADVPKYDATAKKFV
jgi:predicted Zn-dependent peptidase